MHAVVYALLGGVCILFVFIIWAVIGWWFPMISPWRHSQISLVMPPYSGVLAMIDAASAIKASRRFMVIFRTGKLDDVVGLFKQALAKAPQMPSLLLNVGVALMRIANTGDGDYAEAEKYMRKLNKTKQRLRPMMLESKQVSWLLN